MKKRFFNSAIKSFFTVCLLFIASSGLANPLSVAFKPQVPPGEWANTNNCGQTSVLMVMSYYWKSDPTEQGIKDIDDWLFQKYGDPINNYNGSLTDTSKLAALAKEYGGFSNSFSSSGWSLNDLTDNIDSGKPIVAAITASYLSNRGYDYAGGHFVVVLGYTTTHIICNDPGTNSGKFKYYNRDEFSQAFVSQGGAAVVVLPNTPQDRSLARIEDQNSVYWLQNEKAYHVLSTDIIDSQAELSVWDNEKICIYPEGTLQILPRGSVAQEGKFIEGPEFISAEAGSNGLLIRQHDNNDVYFITNGARKKISSPDVFEMSGYDWDDVIIVTEEIMNAIPKEEPIYSPYGNWIKTYSTGGWISAQSLIKTSEGGLLAVGSMPSNIDSNEGAFALKLDSDGNKQWIKRYGNSNWYGLSHVFETAENQYLIAGGHTTRNGSNGLLGLINSSGDIIWQREYLGMNGIRYIEKTSDGGYIASGYRATDIPNVRSYVVLKLGSSLEVEWRTEIALDGNYSVKYPIYETENGEFIFTPGYYGNTPWVIKLDMSGGIDWQKNYVPQISDSSNGMSIYPSADDCFLICGTLKKTYGVQSSRFFVFKIDRSGTVLWSKTYDTPYNEWATSLIEITNGDILVTGPDYDDEDAPNGRILLLRLDKTGNLLWGKNYGYGITKGFNSATLPNAPITIVDNSIYVTGYNKPDSDSNPMQHDLLIMKLNNMGSGGENCDFVSESDVLVENVVLTSYETDGVADRTLYNSVETDIPMTTIDIESWPICQGSAFHDETILQLPFGLQPEFTTFDAINFATTMSYGHTINGVRALQHLILNWAGSEMKVDIYSPDGSLYGEYQDTHPPISIDIPNPDDGTWTYDVTALDIPYDNYPFSLVTGITKYQYDFNSDGDVDGSDLAMFAVNAALYELEIFAANFGKSD